MGLIPCTSCQRHVRIEEKACPFCGTTRASLSGVAGLAAAAALALAGCGGKSAPATAEPPGNEDDGEVVASPDAGPELPPDDDWDRGGDVQPLYGVDRMQ